MEESSINAVVGVALSRAELEAQLELGVRRFEGCGLDGEDLSRLELQGCVFERCTFTDTILFACKLAGTHWLRLWLKRSGVGGWSGRAL
jgi:uncharacterized protein YjbI with pentapeptide repeats